MLVVLDLIGIFVFAVSGGLVAVRKELDVIGILVLATVTGLGGGFLRDVLIGVLPPAALADWRYLLVPIVAGLVAFLFHGGLGRAESWINVLDAVGLGLFAVVGALKAVDAGLGFLPATMLGTLTGVGGGMIRDVLAGRVPVIMRKGELYAIPAIAGAALAVVLDKAGLPYAASTIPAATVTVVWRWAAMRRGWSAPLPRGSAST